MIGQKEIKSLKIWAIFYGQMKNDYIKNTGLIPVF